MKKFFALSLLVAFVALSVCGCSPKTPHSCIVSLPDRTDTSANTTDSSVTDTENNNTSTDQTPPAKYVGCAAGPALPPLKEPPQEVVPPGTFPDPQTVHRADCSDVGTTQTLSWSKEHTTRFVYCHDPVSGKEALIVEDPVPQEGGTYLFTFYDIDVNGVAGLYESIKNGSITLTVRNRVLIAIEECGNLFAFTSKGTAADGDTTQTYVILGAVSKNGEVDSVSSAKAELREDFYDHVKRVAERYSIKLEW